MKEGFTAWRFVRDLQDSRYVLVSNSQDVSHVLGVIGKPHEEAKSLFVWEEEGGDYAEVWACDYTVPYLVDKAYRLA